MYANRFTLDLRSFRNKLNLLLTFAMLVTAVLVAAQSQADASSHREAPLIAQDAFADHTDTYAFISPSNPNNIVLVASWIPGEFPEGGPNYYEWGRGLLYDIHVDNNGDAKPDYTYTLSTRSEVADPLTFLYNKLPIQPDGTNLNQRQYYTITEISAGGTEVLISDALVAPNNIGSKSTNNFGAIEQNFHDVAVDDGDTITIYAGQTDDAFWVDLQVFDLLTLRGQDNKTPGPLGLTVGYPTGNNVPVDSLAGFNVHSLIIEVPISRLTQGSETVLGVWSTTRRPSMRVFNGIAGLGTLSDSGPAVQVSRLGMPLVNEVVIPLALKDAFNSLPAELDAVLYTNGAGTPPGVAALLQKSVEDPELGRLLCALYGVPLPGDANDDCSTEVTVGTVRSGRGDIFDIFLTGFSLAYTFTINTPGGPVDLPPGTNVNKPAGVVPAEMIRINTATPFRPGVPGSLCSPVRSRLGVLGGDACGFPNGRRPFDDIVEAELAVVAGAAYKVVDGRDNTFTFNPALIKVLNDNIDGNDVPFRRTFPYLGLAQSGQEHLHTNPVAPVAPNIATAARVTSKKDDAEESANGKVKRGSSDLELGDDSKVGVRFSNVAIPNNAIIVGAYIQFTAEDANADPAALSFYGEASDDAAEFSSANNNISGRSKTSANAAWNAPAWNAGSQYWSPNLVNVIQEIVSRPGWATGNDLAILIEGTGERIAWSYDGAAGKAPLLYIEYVQRSRIGAAAVTDNTMNNASGVVSVSILDAGAITSDDSVIIDEEIEADDSGNVAPATTVTKVFLPVAIR